MLIIITWQRLSCLYPCLNLKKILKNYGIDFVFCTVQARYYDKLCIEKSTRLIVDGWINGN